MTSVVGSSFTVKWVLFSLLFHLRDWRIIMSVKCMTPWYDEDGILKFPYRPLRDLVLIYPDSPPEKLGKQQLIHIPEQYRKKYHGGVGVILAIGSGYTDSKGRFHPTPSGLKPGVRVMFNIKVPWGVHFEGQDKKKYYVVLCGTSDIFGVVGDREEEKT